MSISLQIFTGTIAGQPQHLTSARALHAALEVGRDFSNWIKDRVAQYGFTEGEDFSPILAKSSGGRPAGDYHLSLDMAKELAMIENTPRGRLARRYFIEMERHGQAAARDLAAIAATLGAELLRADPRRRQLVRYRRLGLTLPEIGRLTGRGRETLNREYRLLEACGLIEVSPVRLARRATALANLRLAAPREAA